MKAKYDEEEIILTEEYIEALKNLMRAEIAMMRQHDKEKDDSVWYCGSATVEDLAVSSGVTFQYGGKDDVESIKEQGQVFVEVPFVKSSLTGKLD